MLDAAKAAHRKAPRILRLAFDVSFPKSVEDASKSVKETFGRLDVVVNNAAIADLSKPVTETDPEEWWTTWTVNMRGPYLVTRYFLPLLLDSVDGLKIIVYVSSIGAHVMRPGASAYQTSKLALLRFTEFVELEYKDKGLLPIALHPGSVLTDMGNGLPSELRVWLQDTPTLPADFVVWLTKDRKEWLSGRYVSANWDVSELEAKKEEIVKGDKLKVKMVV